MFVKRYDLFGKISNRLPNDIFGTNLSKTLGSYWQLLLTLLN